MIIRRLLAGSLLVFLLCSSCGKREQERPMEKGKSAADEFEIHGKTSSDETSEVSLRRALNSNLRGARQVEKFRSELLALAKKKGEEPMNIVAPMLLEGEIPDDQLARLILVLDAFRDPVTQVDLAKHLPAGRMRKLVVSRATGIFEKQKDIAGLQSAYDSLPIGSDRTLLSVTLSKMKIQDEGLLNGLEFIRQLEMPEERYEAIIRTEDAWAAHMKDPQTQFKLDQVVDTMEGNLKENLSLMISNLQRRLK